MLKCVNAWCDPPSWPDFFQIGILNHTGTVVFGKCNNRLQGMIFEPKLVAILFFVDCYRRKTANSLIVVVFIAAYIALPESDAQNRDPSVTIQQPEVSSNQFFVENTLLPGYQAIGLF